jgi:AraC-like DNA-binding protein
MGVSTLHHHFRALTAMSLFQYQKLLRLQAAQEKCQPIQPRIQPFLRLTTDAGYSDSSLAKRSAVGLGQ